MDHVNAERRSEIMAAIRGKDTAPEVAVRRYLHRRGYRYRLHAKGLPGKPDLIFSGKRIALFVHGCFWHGCPKCRVGRRTVKSNTDYWSRKLARNQARDSFVKQALSTAGWNVLTIWACDVNDPAALRRLEDAIGS